MTADDGYEAWLRSSPARSEDGPLSERARRPQTQRRSGSVPGVYWQPRKKGKPGGPIWRCQQHRNLWPDYAEEIPARRVAE